MRRRAARARSSSRASSGPTAHSSVRPPTRPLAPLRSRAAVTPATGDAASRRARRHGRSAMGRPSPRDQRRASWSIFGGRPRRPEARQPDRAPARLDASPVPAASGRRTRRPPQRPRHPPVATRAPAAVPAATALVRAPPAMARSRRRPRRSGSWSGPSEPTWIRVQIDEGRVVEELLAAGARPRVDGRPPLRPDHRQCGWHRDRAERRGPCRPSARRGAVIQRLVLPELPGQARELLQLPRPIGSAQGLRRTRDLLDDGLDAVLAVGRPGGRGACSRSSRRR